MTGGMGRRLKFLFLYFFFVNRFVDCFFVQFLPSSLLTARLCFHVIHPHIIIQHKVRSHLVSFHFFFFNKKFKKIKYYVISHLTFCCVYGYQT